MMYYVAKTQILKENAGGDAGHSSCVTFVKRICSSNRSTQAFETCFVFVELFKRTRT